MPVHELVECVTVLSDHVEGAVAGNPRPNDQFEEVEPKKSLVKRGVGGGVRVQEISDT